jgi:hypothetical protein
MAPPIRRCETASEGGFQPLGEALPAMLVWPRFPEFLWGFGGMLDLP